MAATLTHIKLGVVSRSATSERAAGGNTVALAAYHACARFTGSDGRVFDFTRKLSEHIGATQVFAPPGAPDWTRDLAELARRIESADRKANATPARYIEMSIPRSVRPEDYAAFVAAIAIPLVEQHDVVITGDVHDVPASDGGRNAHLHLLVATRTFEGEELSRKKSASLEKAFREQHGRGMRRALAEAANAWLANNGYHHVRLDPDRRNDGLPPERNVPRAAIAAWKRKPDSEVGDVFERVLSERTQRHRRRAQLAAVEADIAAADAEIHSLRQTYIQLQLNRATGMSSADSGEREARRARHIAALLRDHYDSTWLPPTVAASLTRVELDKGAGRAVLHLRDGNRLVDTGDSIRVLGHPSDLTITELVAGCDRHGWTKLGGNGVRLFGSSDFRRRAAVLLMDRSPPVRVTGIDDSDRRIIVAEISRRAERRRRDAMEVLRNAEQATLVTLKRSEPSDRNAGMARLKAIRDAQAAIVTGDDAAIRAAASGDLPQTLRVGATWGIQQRARAAPPAPPLEADKLPTTMDYEPSWAQRHCRPSESHRTG